MNYGKWKNIQEKNQSILDVIFLIQLDIYSVFEIKKSATPTEIKNKYRDLVIKWHPDKNPECGKICDEKF